MQYKDYYSILGVERGASADDIKVSYRRLARKYHPDVSAEANAEERFKEVQEAYDVLKDKDKRNAYDNLGSHWRQGQEFNPPPNWGGGGFDGVGGGRGFDFSDLFDSLFSQGRPRGPRARRARAWQANAAPRGRDDSLKVTISLEEAFAGTERSFRVSGDAQARTLKVRIPAGVIEGQRIRVPGHGQVSEMGPRRGDLYLEVAIEPHQWFTWEGKDLSLDLPVAPWEVALGTTVKVPTLAGNVDLKVPVGSQGGQKLRLKGRGLGGTTPGDQYVKLKVVVPPADTEAAKAFYAKMAATFEFEPRNGFE